MRLFYLLGWGYVAIAAALLYRSARQPAMSVYGEPTMAPGVPGGLNAWYDAVRPHCNAVEVEVALRNNPPPKGWEGQGYGAACYALAGKIDRAATLIDALPESDRVRAAGIVFDAGHPIADAGDDESAGPIMGLVVRYWPNHYMALYHAGIAEFRNGRPALARKHLEAFLVEYKQDDGWTGSARATLKQIAEGKAR